MTAQPNRSLGHSLEVLHALCGAEEPVGSRELARRLEMEPTRVNRLLGTMALLGLAERTADRRYRPGPAVHVLAASSLRSSGLLQAALPEIRELLKAGHPTALGVLWRDHVCYLFHGKPNQPLERGLGGHQLYPAAWSSIGTVLQAMTSAAHPQIRRQGWAWVVPPHGNGGSLAVPIGDPVVAALAIVPTAGANADHAALAEMLMAAAKRITAALAHTGG